MNGSPAASDDWPLHVGGAAQEPEIGYLQCGLCYDVFWSSADPTSLAELRAAVDDHRLTCKGGNRG